MDKQKYVDVPVGSLETATDTYFIESHPLESSSSVNSGFILHTMKNILR